MTQYTLPTIDPTTNTGTELSNWLNQWRPAIESSHQGPTRPAYAVAGMIWVQTVTAAEWRVNIFDGTTDIQLTSFDPSTGTPINPAGDVFGPAGAPLGNIPQFADATGKLLSAGLTPQASPKDAAPSRVLLTGAAGRAGGPALINTTSGNFNDYINAGTYLIDINLVTVSNSPANGASWLLDVITFDFSGAANVMQIAYRRDGSEIWQRSYTSGAWGQWSIKLMSTAGWYGADLNNIATSGFFNINGSSSSNLPLAGSFGLLYVNSNGLTGTNLNVHQIFVVAGSTQLIKYERVCAAGVWQPWVRTYYNGGSAVPTLLNGFLDANFLRYSRLGGQVTLTGGLGRASGDWTAGTVICNLPSGFRPEAVLGITVHVVFGSGSTRIVTITIVPDGNVAVTFSSVVAGADVTSSSSAFLGLNFIAGN